MFWSKCQTSDITTLGKTAPPPSSGADTAPPTDHGDGLQKKTVSGCQVTAVAIPALKQSQQNTTQQQNNTTTLNQPLGEHSILVDTNLCN